VAEIGEQALASGHRVSAPEACCRASNYYRTAADFLLEHPATDPEITVLSAGQPGTFAAAAARDGHGRTTDGQLEPDLRVPKEMGGDGGATNPEQLFAVR
jgi:hypothetical protein